MTESSPHPRAALALLSVSQFVDVLSVTIAIVALPSIQSDLYVSDLDLQWAVSIYALFFGGFVMLTGRAADLYGRRKLFMAGLALFASASLACGLSKSIGVLVVARAAQGLGAAVVVPAALAILTTIFPEGAARNRALGIWTAAAAGGGAAGFFLGGVITGTLGWPWVFLVNVPVAVLGVALAPVLLTESRVPGISQRLDIPGAATATLGLLSLIYGFTRAQDAGLTSLASLGSLVLGGILLVSFGFIEQRAKDPIAPLSVFRSHSFVGANVVAFVLTGVTSPAAVLATLYLQRVENYSVTSAGFAFVPFSLLVIIGSFSGSGLIAGLGGRTTMVSGIVVVAVALLVLTRIPVAGGLAYVVIGVALCGLGLGLASVASTAVGTSAASSHEQGLAAGLLNTAAQVGTAIGIAALATIAAARTAALASGGDPTAGDFVGGFRMSLYVGVVICVAGIVAALLMVEGKARQPSAKTVPSSID